MSKRRITFAVTFVLDVPENQLPRFVDNELVPIEDLCLSDFLRDPFEDVLEDGIDLITYETGEVTEIA